ncbi:hypothetical protein GQ457_12G007850 [Hibiscus cannabinus]
MEKELKDEIAQAQRNIVSQIAAMLGFREPERGKMIEVDVLSLHPKMNCETFPPKGRFHIHMAGTSAHVPVESRMNHGKKQGREVLDFNEATYKVSVNKKLEDGFNKLEEIIREMQGGNIYGGVDARDLSLVTDLVTPPKFKMSPYLENEKLLIHCFQDNLSGSVARWYSQLSQVNVKNWQDLSRAFLEQYTHVTYMVPSKIVLQDMKPRYNESFRQYFRRWRDVVAQVQPPLLESEVTPMFVESLIGPFYNHMLNHANKDFADMVLNGEFILAAIRSGSLKEEEYDEH